MNQSGQVTFIKIKINHFGKNRGKYFNSIVGVEYSPARGRARSGRSCGFMLLIFMSRGIADISKIFILLAGERDLVDLVELFHLQR